MRPRLWHRWFLMSAGLVLLALTGLLWAQASGFERGLLAYARTLEQSRLPEIAARLADEYRDAGDWRRLQMQPRRWQRLVRLENAGPGGPPPAWRPTPSAPARGDPTAPRRLPRGQGLDFIQRLSLLDADHERMFGPPPHVDALRLPIEVDGVVVGELALTPMPELYDAAALEFAASQRRFALWVALPVLLVAVLASWATSRRLLRRLDTMASASRRLAAGDYGTRVGAQGKDELGELAVDFDRMAESLQAAQVARDRWIADISHELRTPLTILRGELHALQDGIRPLDAKALGSLLFESERLARRIDDLYALALSESGGLRYRFECVDFSALLSTITQARRPAFDQARLALVLDVDSPVLLARGDASRLEQLVENLLGNALGYTAPGGEVRIQLRHDKGVARLQVDDTAPGVSPSELPHLLKRHFRAGNSSPQAGRAGLGLAICRNIAQAHGGRIDVSPSPLGGLCVCIELPMGASA
jgi:two-component system sensor histidine kinase BaeS